MVFSVRHRKRSTQRSTMTASASLPPSDAIPQSGQMLDKSQPRGSSSGKMWKRLSGRLSLPIKGKKKRVSNSNAERSWTEESAKATMVILQPAPLLPEVNTIDAQPGASEDRKGRGRDDEKTSEEDPTIVEMIPEGLPMVRYVVEAYEVLERGCSDNNTKMEWELLVLSIRRQRWELSKLLATKMERQISLQQLSSNQAQPRAAPDDQRLYVQDGATHHADSQVLLDQVMAFLTDCQR